MGCAEGLCGHEGLGPKCLRTSINQAKLTEYFESYIPFISSTGSPQLAACMEKAQKHALRSLPEIPAPSKSDIDFTFTGEGYRTGDVSASLRIKNNSASSRIIAVHLCAAAAYYTGVPANDLKENSSNAQLEPHAGL